MPKALSWLDVERERAPASRRRQGAVVVAVLGVHVMKVTVDEVVDVVAVRNRLVATCRSMHVRCGVAPAVVIGRAVRRVRGVDKDRAFIDVIVVHVMEMAIVEIVDVAGVVHRRMSTRRAVGVFVSRVRLVSHAILCTTIQRMME